jgi:hypothetical protein
MHTPLFAENASSGVVVDHERVPRSSAWLYNRVDAVIGGLRDLHEQSSVEDRLYLSLFASGILVPQLELSAIFRTPVAVEVDDQSQTADQSTGDVSVGIDVNIELSLRRDDAVAGSMHIRIGQEIPNSRYLGEKIEERSGMEESHELKSGRTKPRRRLLPKLFQVLGVVMDPVGLSGV